MGPFHQWCRGRARDEPPATPLAPAKTWVDSLYIQCDLAIYVHVVGNFKNCLLDAMAMEGWLGQVRYYELVHWTEIKHVYVVLTDAIRWQNLLCEVTAEVER